MYQLLVFIILPSTYHSPPEKSSKIETKQPPPEEDLTAVIGRRAALLTAVHLLNPLVFSISTRGSSESVLSLFVLLTLYCALKSRWNLAAVFLGLSTHWKIYPFIYGVACLGVIGSERGVRKGWKGYVASRGHRRKLLVVSIAALLFVGIGSARYATGVA